MEAKLALHLDRIKGVFGLAFLPLIRGKVSLKIFTNELW